MSPVSKMEDIRFKQLELAVGSLQEQRNAALDTAVNLKIEIGMLKQQLQDAQMENNRMQLELAAKQEELPLECPLERVS